MRPISICGHRKTGTTLLSNLLDGHPELVNYGTDLKLIYSIYNGYFLNKNRFCTIQKFKKIFEDDRDKISKINWNFILPIVKNLNFKDKEFIWDYLEKLTKKTRLEFPGKRIFIKETSSEIYRRSIHKSIKPDFIYCVRDPRDNWAAIKSGIKKYYSKLGENNLEALASLINRVNIGHNSFKRSLKFFKKKNFFVLKFENLVLKPKKELIKLSKFLNIEFKSSLLKPTKENLIYHGNSHDKFKFKEISKRNLSKFKLRASISEIAIIEALCSEMMSFYNYKSITSEKQKEEALENFYSFYNHRYFYYDKFSKK